MTATIAPFTPFTPAKLDALEAAWRDYRAACKPLYLSAPGIEREFFRTQDQARYTRMRRWLTQRSVAAVAQWTAACRRILRRDVLLEPLGTTQCGAPQCFLVRVPNQGELAMHEHIFGRPPKDDEAACERVAQVLHSRAKEREVDAVKSARKTITSYYYAKMFASLKAARTHLAYKQLFREWKARTPKDTADYHLLAKLSYYHHARYVRTHTSAVKWRNRLAREGHMYNFDIISTPIEIVEPKELRRPA